MSGSGSPAKVLAVVFALAVAGYCGMVVVEATAATGAEQDLVAQQQQKVQAARATFETKRQTLATVPEAMRAVVADASRGVPSWVPQVGAHDQPTAVVPSAAGAPAPAGVDTSTDARSPVDLGKELYMLKGCVGCHTVDGTPRAAPSFKGLFGRMETLQDGSEVLVDEAYLRESILNPTAKIARGFQPIMPPMAGLLSDKEIEGLSAYIASLAD